MAKESLSTFRAARAGVPARRLSTYKMQYCFALRAVALTLVLSPTIAQGQTVPVAGFASNYTGNATTEAPPASPPPPPGKANEFAKIPVSKKNLACNFDLTTEFQLLLQKLLLLEPCHPLRKTLPIQQTALLPLLLTPPTLPFLWRQLLVLMLC